ncbi:MAG: serine/threonine-protein phosphatase [Polyangiaceae bacterium]|nr:serine/threonine-protein phosphatase [Polyangiaceae bacterium]
MRRSAPGVVVDLAAESDPGRDPAKQNNEDTFASVETALGLLLVVCDGMGGHLGGRRAAEAATSTIVGALQATPAGASRPEALRSALVAAGGAVHAVGGESPSSARPGSTAVVALLHAGGVDIAHVGDSRAYLFRSDRLHPLTRDHSVVQAMIDQGLLTPEAARGHPEANRITRALGIYAAVEPEVRPEPVALYPRDVLLLASDGLTDMLADSDLEAALRQHLHDGADAAAQALVRLANAQGGWDNITVQLAIVAAASHAAASAASAPTQAPAPGVRTVPLAAPAPASPPVVAGTQPFTYMGSPATTTLPLGASLSGAGDAAGVGDRPVAFSTPPGPPAPPRRTGKIAVLAGAGCAALVVFAVLIWWAARLALGR